jgi:hypothetical protein
METIKAQTARVVTPPALRFARNDGVGSAGREERQNERHNVFVNAFIPGTRSRLKREAIRPYYGKST